MLFRNGLISLYFIGLSYSQVYAQDEPKKVDTDIQENKDWSHDFHQTIANSVFYSATWFDSFFLEEGDEQITPKTSARIKLGWEPKAREWGEFGTRFKVKVRLPHFKDKVDLIFSDDSDDDLENLPLESIKVEPDNNNDNFAAAIRYIFKDKKNTLTDTRLGISGGDLFIRARHRRIYQWQDTHSFKLEPAILYSLDEKTGARLLLEYNYQINAKNQLRLDYSLRGSESFHGVRWKYGIYNLKHIADRKASILGLQAEGERNGENGFIIDKYTVNYRYRFGAIKDWLFFEIEPFIEFPEEENYTATPGLALRVEGYFYKKEN